MHVIFGAGGATANALTRELLNNNHAIRLVSRRPVDTAGKNIVWQKGWPDLALTDRSAVDRSEIYRI